MNIHWLFDTPPASGKRSGGNAAMYALTPSLEIFIREVIQNSKDQGPIDKTKPVSIIFRVITLTEHHLEDFLKSIKWDELEKHLQASDSDKINMPYRQNIERLKEKKELTIMIVEDTNTTGLCGPEFGYEESNINKNFSSLIRDELYSDKLGDTSGGSYGLGKAVLWRFSQFSTVLFSSKLSELDKNYNSALRFIGRTSLPWHETTDKKFYTGDGWFGNEEQINKDSTAVSVWGNEADEFTKQIFNVTNYDCGTSVLILGFYEPINEDREIDEIIKDMDSSIKKWFWPSLFSKRKSLEVRIESWENDKRIEYKEITKTSDLEPFIEALNHYENNELKSELNDLGDIIKTEINVALPGKYDGTPRCDCKATLLIRLSNSETEKELINNVAFYRGFGMVTEYLNLKGLSFTARPFHAVLVCGDARVEEDENNARLEEFLTYAEPPEHTRWESNERLKKYFKQGYRKALFEMHNDVKLKIKDFVSEKISSGNKVQNYLCKNFHLVWVMAGGGQKSKFYFQNLKAELVNNLWNFSGDIITSKSIKNDWYAEVDLQFLDEEGGGEGGVIKEAHATYGKNSIDEGIYRVEVPKNITNITFKGTSDPTRHPIDAHSGAVRLVINAKEVEVLDANN